MKKVAENFELNLTQEQLDEFKRARVSEEVSRIIPFVLSEDLRDTEDVQRDFFEKFSSDKEFQREKLKNVPEGIKEEVRMRLLSMR